MCSNDLNTLPLHKIPSKDPSNGTKGSLAFSIATKNMIISSNPTIISCTSPSIIPPKPRPQTPKLLTSKIHLSKTQLRPHSHLPIRRLSSLHICHSSSTKTQNQDPSVQANVPPLGRNGNGGGGGGGGGGSDWTTSVLLFGLWAALMYYVFLLAPNLTPSLDMYFLQKLLNLKGDDGFVLNEVLASLWYIMGLWPLVYSMLLLPTGRSSKSKIPVWPFVVLSFIGGAYALLPYFVLWRPPPPNIDEDEIQKWPLNFLESKITAGLSLAAGLGLIIYAGLANGDTWTEFYQYFRGSKLIHVTSLDFLLMSAFAPFWVYNDMTARKWFDKGSWLLPVALIPFLGPSLYLILRPSLSSLLTQIPSVPADSE